MGKKRSPVVVEATIQRADADTTSSEGGASTSDKLQFYFFQHLGLAVVIAAIGLLWKGYGQGWMHDTTLCLLCLGLCLVGLFFHETRPWNVEEIYKQQQEAANAASTKKSQ